MKLLIIDDNGNLHTEVGVHVVMVMRDPHTIPALSVYPRGANVGAWHRTHSEVLAEREDMAREREQ